MKSSSCWNTHSLYFHQQHVCSGHRAFAVLGWGRSRGLRLGLNKNQKGQLTFLPPKGDGHAAPVKPDKIVMSKTPRLPACSLRRLCKWKCQLLFPRLAQPRERLGPATLPLTCRVTHSALLPARFCGQNNLLPTFMGVINSWGLAPLCVVPMTF